MEDWFLFLVRLSFHQPSSTLPKEELSPSLKISAQWLMWSAIFCYRVPLFFPLGAVFQLITRLKRLSRNSKWTLGPVPSLIQCLLWVLWIFCPRASFSEGNIFHGSSGEACERLPLKTTLKWVLKRQMNAERHIKKFIERLSVSPSESKCQCCVMNFLLMKHCFLRGRRHKLGNWRWKSCRRVCLDEDFPRQTSDEHS